MILTLLSWILASPAIGLLAIFVAEIFAGLVPVQARRGTTPAAVLEGTVDLAVIMPAHNEATLIVRTLEALSAVLPPNARVMVVADNCTDDTAQLARTQAVIVIERNDPVRRGKGFALAFARDALAQRPPDAIVVIDADCIPAPGTLTTLGAAAVQEGRPVQSINLLREAPFAPPMVQISSFAFLVKNLIRQRGSARLADVGILGGTGMAMPWHLFAEAPLASDDIVEDLSLGIWATRQGHPPRLLEGARVESDAAARGDTLGQRARWEHGFLRTARTQALPLVAEGIGKRDAALFWLGLHLCVPPLALLIATTAGIVTALGALTACGASATAVTILVAVGGLAAFGIILAWMKEGRGVLSGAALLQAPLYVLWKLPIYLKLLAGSRSGWRRTPRDEQKSD
jgi:cellulose synthase/poly-beta-1,6-N-acetylglucosamine synthase-like glycosyltransferase